MILQTGISFQLAVLRRKIQLSVFINQRYKSWKVMFFGSDDFSLASLEALKSCLEKKLIQNLEIVSLSTSNIIFSYAAKNNLKHHVWPPILTEYFDIGIVVSFGKLIPKEIIDHFPLGILNVHGSLLPQYRGAMPIFHALKNGDSVTGVTIMKIKPFVFDIGDIVMQEKYHIGCNELMPSVRKKLALLGAKCLADTINGLPHILEQSVPQPSQNASFAPKVKKDIAIVQWNKLTASEVYNLYRSLFGLYDLKTTWNSFNLKLICISLHHPGQSQTLNIVDKLSPGSFEYSRRTRCLSVHCRDGLVSVCSLRIKNKLIIASDFYSGYLQRVPKEQWVFR